MSVPEEIYVLMNGTYPIKAFVRRERAVEELSNYSVTEQAAMTVLWCPVIRE
jgi:hypothetical protein